MARYGAVSTGGAPAARWSGATTGTRFSTGPTVTRYSGGYGGGLERRLPSSPRWRFHPRRGCRLP